MLVDDTLVVVRQRGQGSWFEGHRRRGGRLVKRWEHELTGDGAFRWHGYASWLAVGSAVDLGDGRVALVGLQERLVVEAADGSLRARRSGCVPASGRAAVVDGLLVVPERTQLSVYEPTSLDVQQHAAVPRGWYVFGTPAHGLVGIEDDADEPSGALWAYADDEVIDTPVPPRHPAALGDTALVVADDVGAAGRIVGPQRGSGQLLWSREFPDTAASPRARPPLAAQLVPQGGLLWGAVASQAVVALDPATGELRRQLEVDSDVTALLVTSAHVVAGTGDGVLHVWTTGSDEPPERLSLPWHGQPAGVLVEDGPQRAVVLGSIGGVADLTW